MTREQWDEERLVEWLSDGPDRAPAGPLVAAVSYARAHPRRRTPEVDLWRRLMTRTQRAELQPRPHRQFQFATAAVVAVVAIAMTVAVAGTVILRSPDVGPAVVPTASPPAPTPAPATTVTPAPTVTPTASPTPAAVVGTSWQRVSDPDITGLPMGSLYGAIPGGPGAIAWGEVYGTGPRIWTTANGRDWTAATVETPTDFDKDQRNPGAVLDVTAGGPGYVAVGVYTRTRGLQTALIWTSTDGTAWRRVPDDPVFADATLGQVVAWEGELLAFGCAGCGMESGPTQGWTSPDGVTWTRFTPTLPAGSQVVDRVTPSADRLWATGGPVPQTGPSMTRQPVRLTSLDGRTWTASALPGAGGVLHALPDGLYLTVTTPTTGGAKAGVYRSTDAATWTAVTVGKPVEPELVAVGDTLVMVGGAAWRSTDGGLTWDAAPITGAVPVSVTGIDMAGVAALPDGTLVGVGTNLSGDAVAGRSPSTAAWVSSPKR